MRTESRSDKRHGGTTGRIRDKFAASKAKGMWMGGVVPLGYDVHDRKLKINEDEARSVRWLFDTYLELGSVIRLREAAEHKGIQSKRRNYKSGRNLGGKPLTRGHLHAILANTIYTGRIAYKGNIHDGQHQAIIGIETFDRVQALLQENAVRRRSSNNVPQPHLLTGIVFDETGDRLSPTHASKNGRRYRYYVSHRLIQSRRKDGEGWRLPAEKLERIVIRQVIGFLHNRAAVFELVGLDGADAGSVLEASARIDRLVEQLQSDSPNLTREILQSLVHRITASPDKIVIEINRDRLANHLAPSGINGTPGDDPIVITAPVRLRRRGIETRLILGQDSQTTSDPDPALVRILGEAWHYREALMSGQVRSLGELAETSDRTSNEISRILPLAFLAPDIVKQILDGRQPAELTAHSLKRTRPLPIRWADQRERLGFSAED